jgi:hypothetical protein
MDAFSISTAAIKPAAKERKGNDASTTSPAEFSIALSLAHFITARELSGGNRQQEQASTIGICRITDASQLAPVVP